MEALLVVCNNSLMKRIKESNSYYIPRSPISRTGVYKDLFTMLSPNKYFFIWIEIKIINLKSIPINELIQNYPFKS